jgi:hypothetical protein
MEKDYLHETRPVNRTLIYRYALAKRAPLPRRD